MKANDAPGAVSALELLAVAIHDEERRLRTGLPANQHAALLALIQTLDRPPVSNTLLGPDLVTGRDPLDLGGKLALCICSSSLDEANAATNSLSGDMSAWAARMVRDCGRLVAAQTVLKAAEGGTMKVSVDDAGGLHAWFATKLPPPGWRERRDIAWWSGSLARARAPDAMGAQLGYPPEAVAGGVPVQTYLDVLARLIARATVTHERGDWPRWENRSRLTAELSADLELDAAVVSRAIAGFTLDRDNAAYHAGVTGGGSVPLVGIGPDEVALSHHGLTTEPLFFLTRNLRYRDADGYNNSAVHREGQFRADLYALFLDRRFVTSPGRIQVRRAQGDLRTDIDAAIFDRKSGALALFELKSHDPFARSSAELARQRDNVLYANRQLSAVLDWVKRHGADDLLSRIDQPTAKRYRVQKVFPFVLGRYLVRFNDGPAPDRRAAWGTWPQVLRAVGEPPPLASVSSPLATLFARLHRDDPFHAAPVNASPEPIPLGERQLTVYPAYAAYKAHVS